MPIIRSLVTISILYILYLVTYEQVAGGVGVVSGSGGAQEYSLFKDLSGGSVAMWADHNVDLPPPQVRRYFLFRTIRKQIYFKVTIDNTTMKRRPSMNSIIIRHLISNIT